MQFLAHYQNDGSMDIGRIPRWYSDVQGAKYAGVTLEAWYGMPWFYRSRYEASMQAETEAQIELKRFHDGKNKTL